MPTNVRLSGSNTGFRSESDIRFNYGNLDQIIGACNDLQNSTLEIFRSTDGGSTWSDVQLPTVSGDAFQSDPAVDWTSDGTAWALAIRVISNPPLVANVGSFKSTDQGATWTHESDLSPTNTSTDKASLWVDHSPTSAYRDHMYAIWHDGNPTFLAMRTGPGGTWNTPIQLTGSESAGTTDGSDVKTNAYGDVFAFWPSSGNRKLFVSKSTDGGTTFASPVQIGATNGSFLYPIPAQATRSVLIYITAGAYRTATEDYVYACWHDLAGGSGCSSNSDAPGSATSTCKNRIWFTRSTDGGATWESPYKINDQSSLNDQFFPRMVCDQTSGTLMVVYYDTIGNSDRVHTDIWMQTSTDNGVTWSGATQITTSESDEAGSSANGNQYGDYIGITGNDGNFFACWTDSRNSIEEIWGAAMTTTSIQIALQKSTYGKDEVGSGASFAPAYWLEVSGFPNSQLGLNTTADLSNNPNPAPTFAATINASLNPTLTTSQVNSISSSLSTVNFAEFGPSPITPTDPTLEADTQIFFYPYTVDFTSGSVFDPLLIDQTAIITLTATFTVGSITRTASANIELTAGENPYFEDLNPAAPSEYPSWLSFDLRFFKISVPPSAGATTSRFGATMSKDPSEAPGFIATAIANLTAGNGSFGTDSFDTLSQDEDSTTIEFLPQDASHNYVFNFAVARVRLKGNTPGATAQKVRVFFRLFQAQSTVTNFDANTTYRSHSDGVLYGVTVPLLGIQNNEYVTIPCFAVPRVNLNTPADMNAQPEDTPNAYTIDVTPGVEVDSFFGCWLDINQPQQQFLPQTPPSSDVDGPFSGTLYSLSQVIARAPHQCLVAEIRFDDTPIPAGANSSNSDKLAQRNIAWIDGPNPGVSGSRRMPHPFEIRATPSNLSAPDELLVFWGNTPEGSTASFYLPAVNAADVVALAGALYPEHQIEVTDPHTIQCPVGGATLIPIPRGTARNAGLLTVDLPPNVRRGDKYTISVIQLTQGRGVVLGTQAPKSEGLPVAEFESTQTFSWRQMLGAFRVTIPITTKSEILAPEEELYAWLLWIQKTLPTQSRWYPVFQRYLRLIAGRITGFGGDPGHILPSPTGGIPPYPPPRHGGPGSGPGSGAGSGAGSGSHIPGIPGICFTGKIIRVIYDRFGDFEGFVLLTEGGEFHHFKGHELRVEELIRDAWEERTVVTVCVEPHKREWPISIILDRAP